MAEPAQQFAGAGAVGNVSLRDAQGIGAAMGFRQQAAPRHGDDRSPMPVVQQGQHVIDHGQPGAQQQHGCVLVDAGGGRRRPGIGVAGEGGQHGVMAGGEDCDIPRMARAVRQRRLDAAGAFIQRDAFALHDGEARRRAVVRRARERRDQACDVVPVDAPGHEAEGIRTKRRLRCARGEPAPEMVGIVRQRAHVRHPHIQQVVRIAGVVGEPAADLRPLFNQGHAEAARRIAQQLMRQQHAAGAAPDDDRVSFSVRAHAIGRPFAAVRFCRRPVCRPGARERRGVRSTVVPPDGEGQLHI